MDDSGTQHAALSIPMRCQDCSELWTDQVVLSPHRNADGEQRLVDDQRPSPGCPNCGSMRSERAEQIISDAAFGKMMDLLFSIRELPDTATSDEIATVIEQAAPELEPAARLVRRRDLLVGGALGLLSWAIPSPLDGTMPYQENDEPPSVAGVTPEDYAELVDELRALREELARQDSAPSRGCRPEPEAPDERHDAGQGSSPRTR